METIAVEIGATQIRIESGDPAFSGILRQRYGTFIGGKCDNPISLRVEVVTGSTDDSGGDGDLTVTNRAGVWTIARGDCQATYDASRRSGSVRQTANPWSIDALIRIVHSLELAAAGGFLIHAASAIRNKRAFIFAGPSGAGKTTISRLAPESVDLLTDEISYVRESRGRFHAWGTPFAGELGTPGLNTSAPIECLYFLEHAPKNCVSRLDGSEALRGLMKNILFFASDPNLVRMVFETAAVFLEKTDVYRLSFTPDTAVWSLIE